MIMELVTYMQKHGVQPVGAPISVYRELAQDTDPSKEHELEIVWPIASKIEESDTIKCYELPGGDMATTVHKGPYEQIGATYEQLMKWIESMGKHVTGPMREAYLNDPQAVGMDNALTRIWIPV